MPESNWKLSFKLSLGHGKTDKLHHIFFITSRSAATTIAATSAASSTAAAIGAAPNKAIGAAAPKMVGCSKEIKKTLIKIQLLPGRVQ